MDQKRTEPLITKAYNAFRETTTHQSKPFDADNLIPTEAYLDEKQKASFRDTTMSGLRHAQHLMDSTTHGAGVSTAGDGQSDLYGVQGLPPIQQPRVSSTSGTNIPPELQPPVSELELIQHIQKMQESNMYQEGYKSQRKAMNRLGSMARQRPQMIRHAAIVDINRNASLPGAKDKRKNKNDFYRFLLSTNRSGLMDNRVNNDVLIPRSILKKSYAPGSIKE